MPTEPITVSAREQEGYAYVELVVRLGEDHNVTMHAGIRGATVIFYGPLGLTEHLRSLFAALQPEVRHA